MWGRYPPRAQAYEPLAPLERLGDATPLRPLSQRGTLTFELAGEQGYIRLASAPLSPPGGEAEETPHAG